MARGGGRVVTAPGAIASSSAVGSFRAGRPEGQTARNLGRMNSAEFAVTWCGQATTFRSRRFNSIANASAGHCSRSLGDDADAARQFARHVDLAGLAPRIAAPLLVVDVDRDIIPGVTNGEPVARLAPHGTYLPVPHGDHLVGNARPDWLPRLGDHIMHTLTGTPV